MTTRLLCTAALLALTLPASAQSFWTVDDRGGADFTSLQAAIDAASAGDVILIENGLIESVTIDKGLYLTSGLGVGVGLLKPTGASTPAVRIHDLPADETVVLSNMTVFVGDSGAPAAVQVEDCDGAVWLQDLFVDSYGAASLSGDGAASVVLVDTFLQTNLVPALPDGTPTTAPGALMVGDSRLFGYSSTLAGSHGTLQGPGDPTPVAPADGGAGVELHDSFGVFASTTLGGSGGNSLLVGGCMQGGDGGPGAILSTSAAPGAGELLLVGQSSAISGGFGGFFDPGCASAPSMGQAVVAGPGTSHTLGGAGPDRVFHVPGLVAPGAPFDLTISGAVGDQVYLLAALGGGPALAVGPAAWLHLDFASLVFLTSFALPVPEVAIPLVMPALPPGSDGLVLPMQVVSVDAALGFRSASAPRVLIAH